MLRGLGGGGAAASQPTACRLESGHHASLLPWVGSARRRGDRLGGAGPMRPGGRQESVPTGPAQPQLPKAPHPAGPVEASFHPLRLFQPPSASPKPRRSPWSPPQSLPGGHFSLPRRWQGKQSFRKVGAEGGCPGKLLRPASASTWGFGSGGGRVPRQGCRIAEPGGACAQNPVLFVPGSSVSLFLLGTCSPAPLRSFWPPSKPLAYARPRDPSSRSFRCTSCCSPPLSSPLGWPCVLFSTGHAAPAHGLPGLCPSRFCKVGPWRSPELSRRGRSPGVHPNPTALGLAGISCHMPLSTLWGAERRWWGFPAPCCGVAPKPRSGGSTRSLGIVEGGGESPSLKGALGAICWAIPERWIRFLLACGSDGELTTPRSSPCRCPLPGVLS